MRTTRLWALVLLSVLLAGVTVACQPPENAAEPDTAENNTAMNEEAPAEENMGEEEPMEESAEEEMADEEMDEGAMEEPAADGEALVIGALLPFTGDLSDFGQNMYNAVELAVNEINEAGGVNGQPVQLVRGDTGTAPQQGTEEARRLIEVEGVDAIIGAASSGVTLAVAESVTGPSGVVQISPASTSPALTVAEDDGYLFRTTISDAAQGVVLADLAAELGIESACALYVNNAYGQGLAEVFADSFGEAGEVTSIVPHEQEQPSYAAELATCTEGEPGAMAAVGYPESARVYLREAIEQDVVGQFLFVDGTKSDDMFADLGWENFEGMYGTAPGALDREIGAAFDSAYEAAYGELPPLPFLRESYDAAYVIALAAQSAGSSDSTAIRDALQGVASPPGTAVNPGVDGWSAAVEALAAGDEVNYEGAASPVDFDDNGDVLKGAIEVWMIQDGAIVVDDIREVDLSEAAMSDSEEDA